jgi:hypothetical protein
MFAVLTSQIGGITSAKHLNSVKRGFPGGMIQDLEWSRGDSCWHGQFIIAVKCHCHRSGLAGLRSSWGYP